jgi:hypothetical protein
VGILLCQLTGANAFGADLTLAVPVNVSNLPPQVVSVWVSCVFSGMRTTSGSAELIGGVSPTWASVPGIVNGTVNTFVTFGITLPEFAKTTYVKYLYGCNLLFSGDATHNTVHAVNYPNPPLAASKPGTTPKTFVNGEFP